MLLLYVEMKAVFHKIAALCMALVVMFSTMSFSINMHYCMDHLVDTSLIFPAEDCGMNMMTINANDSDEDQFSSASCCSEKHIAVEGQDEINPTNSGSLELDAHFVAAFVYTFSFLYEGQSTEQPEFKDYSPPLITRDLPVIYETYLI